MSTDFLHSSETNPRHHFESATALRNAVLSKGDEYSEYERSILEEINELRRDPVAYSFVVESEATVGYPFVRDDPEPAECTEMTLEQLRVYIEDFRRERREVRDFLQHLQKEWADAESAMKERWSAEDVERSKKSKRGSATLRKQRVLVHKEEDYAGERQRAAQELTDHYTQQAREAKSKLTQLERSCRWAVDGANLIIKCAHELREANAVPELEYSRSLTLAARDVGKECHGAPAIGMQSPQSSLFSPLLPPSITTGDEDRIRFTQSPSTASTRQGSSVLRLSIVPSSPAEENRHAALPPKNSIRHDAGGVVDVLFTRREENGERAPTPLLKVGTNSLQNEPPHGFHSHDFSSECDCLAKLAMKACGKYGYYSAAIRGVRICGAFSPRKMLIQMLLGTRVPQFTVPAPTAPNDSCEPFTSSQTKQTKATPLLWANGRLLGIGWVRAINGTVSVTALVATSFEELSLIHERRDFTLPQLHRILNTSCSAYTRTEQIRPAVMHIQSLLGVQVVEPVAHPILVDKEQRVARLLVRADPNCVEVTATVSCVSEAIPSIPLLDRELLLVQRSRDDIEKVEILLDTQAAWHRWSGHPLLVHIFERDKTAHGVKSFKNIGFVRVIPLQRGGDWFMDSRQFTSPSSTREKDTAVVGVPPLLVHKRYVGPMEGQAESCGWPLVTVNFQELCATLIEPIRGKWIACGEMQHVAIQIPKVAYLEKSIKDVRVLLEKEQAFFEWEATSGSQERMNEVIKSKMATLKVAENELQEKEGPMQQELAQLQKNMVKKRGKEMAKLKRQEEELRQRMDDMKKNVEELRQSLSNAQEDLVQLGREYALRVKRQRNLRKEYERLRDRTDRTKPLIVEVVLVTDETTRSTVAENTRLQPTNNACTLYEGDVRLTLGFKGCALLLVNEQEVVRWEVRPG
ncbi:hypothetical protein TCDM_05507 [Trypanosoma cruzi Dm28c]|uniref:Uncharacterized protein n=1 Tax=Trypanosoma cruzi Dm28c TaxID=1416333 RepID=V5BIT6_TRYCR|nr:hypothetical protein TCDM_05507 [Trypanosoma cruzi Dm28c]